MVESDQAAEVASLDNALNNPDFTSVFAPIDPQASRKKMAKQAGVEPVILMEHVTKIYPAQPNKPALDDINIEIYPGEFVFLVGHSGSGKTTLLSTLNRDVKPTSGRILVAGQDLMKIKNRKVPFLRRQIGAVFQDFKLLPQKTAYENVAFALQCIGKPKGVIRSQVPEVLRLVGLADQMDSLPDQLSGGEQQRVAIARALANDPQVLLCDEATSALDPQTTKAILHLLKHLNETLGITIVLITHEMAVVKEICDRVAVMEYGRVVEQGEVFTVFAEPKQDITKSFIHTTSNLQKVEALIAEDSPVTRLQPGELIVRLSYVQRNVNEPIISAVSQMFNVSLNIIFADITIVQDSPIGGTVAIISGERKQITKAIEYLIEKNVGVEVIKDARADR